uniref:Uncharacterized protein n=1 Tax=Hordeum vulgare subsp. vulgare TaxID=112509 RepID=A0A8I6WLB9_HORVV
MGRKYTIHGIECSFSARTFVESHSLEFPTYPKHLISIHEVMRCPNKTFVGMNSNIYNTNTGITFVYQFD